MRLAYTITETYEIDTTPDNEIVLTAEMRVYELEVSDYGSAAYHTIVEGERHLSVSFREDGDYPFCTVPARILMPKTRIV